jgi:purine-cytosine permease-like protein
VADDVTTRSGLAVSGVGDPGDERRVRSSTPELGHAVAHDYSTSATGVVPLTGRRPLWHFAGLWLTFQSGFSFLFAGFTLHDAGYRLSSTFGILVLAAAVYTVYGTFAAYLGSRSGQTSGLLTRSIFGRAGSLLISGLLVIVPIGWVGFQANLLAQIWNGLYGWEVMWIGVGLAVLMVIPNIFGFVGISAIARYVITPLMFVWICYFVIKGLAHGAAFLGAKPRDLAPLTFWPALGAIIGFAIWGNEPDLFRYGKPRFWWPVPAYIFGFTFGLILFGVGGWMVAQVSENSHFGPAIRATTAFSLFGAFWLAWLLGLAGQVATNNGNYYEAVNGAQNLLGGWKRWRRLYTCLLLAAAGGFAAWLVPYHLSDGFVKLGQLEAITLPSATIIMVTDHFVVPRAFGVSRSLANVPTWEQAGLINWPGVTALIIAILFGAYAQGIIGSTKINWYFAIAETWILASVLYLVGVWITRLTAPNPKTAMGFSRSAKHEDIPAGAIVDVASAERTHATVTTTRQQAEPNDPTY